MYTCEALSRRTAARGIFSYGTEINGCDLGAFVRGEVLERFGICVNFFQTPRIAWNSARRKYRDNLQECRAALGSAENCQPAE